MPGLFDDITGRQPEPIRVLVAMLIPKEGFGWSDEKLHEAAHINLLVHRALGLVNLTDEVPVEWTYDAKSSTRYALIARRLLEPCQTTAHGDAAARIVQPPLFKAPLTILVLD